MTDQEATSLTLADLALMANIIQVTTERGAIKAPEMAGVGTLYLKLTSFIKAAQDQQAAAQAAAAQAPTGEINNG